MNRTKTTTKRPSYRYISDHTGYALGHVFKVMNGQTRPSVECYRAIEHVVGKEMMSEVLVPMIRVKATV